MIGRLEACLRRSTYSSRRPILRMVGHLDSFRPFLDLMDKSRPYGQASVGQAIEVKSGYKSKVTGFFSIGFDSTADNATMLSSSSCLSDSPAEPTNPPHGFINTLFRSSV